MIGSPTEAGNLASIHFEWRLQELVLSTMESNSMDSKTALINSLVRTADLSSETIYMFYSSFFCEIRWLGQKLYNRHSLDVNGIPPYFFKHAKCIPYGSPHEFKKQTYPLPGSGKYAKFPIIIHESQKYKDGDVKIGTLASCTKSPPLRLHAILFARCLTSGGRGLYPSCPRAIMPGILMGDLSGTDSKIVCFDIDDAREDKNQPLSYDNMHPRVKEQIKYFTENGCYCEASMSGKGIHAFALVDPESHVRLISRANVYLQDGVKIEFYPQSRGIIITGLEVPGFNINNKLKLMKFNQLLRFTEDKCKDEKSKRIISVSKPHEANREQNDDFAKSESAPATSREDQRSQADMACDLKIVEEIIWSSRSLRNKIALFNSERKVDRESLDASSAEFHFACEVLRATDFDVERAATILRHHTPFKLGRESKLLRDDYIEATISAALNKCRSQKISQPTDNLVDKPRDSSVPQHGDVGTSPVKNRASRRRWLATQKLSVPFLDWSEESYLRLDPSTKRIFDLTSSSKKDYQRPDLLEFRQAENCCDKFTTTRLNCKARIHVSIEVENNGGANLSFRHYWCNKASCKCCAHGARSEACDLAAILFPSWSDHFYVYESSNWSGVRTALNCEVGGMYVRVPISSNRWLIFSPKPVEHDSLKEFAELKVRDAILLFADKIWSIPVGCWLDGKPVAGKLAIGGKEWSFGHVFENPQVPPGNLIFSESWNDVSIPAIKQAISEMELTPEPMIGLRAKSGNFYSVLKVHLSRSSDFSIDSLIQLVNKIHARAREIIAQHFEDFFAELIENYRPSKVPK